MPRRWRRKAACLRCTAIEPPIQPTSNQSSKHVCQAALAFNLVSVELVQAVFLRAQCKKQKTGMRLRICVESLEDRYSVTTPALGLYQRAGHITPHSLVSLFQAASVLRRRLRLILDLEVSIALPGSKWPNQAGGKANSVLPLLLQAAEPQMDSSLFP